MNRRHFALFLLGTYCKGLHSMTTEDARSAAVEYVSKSAFAPTLDRLVGVIESAGMRIFARIDHAAGAREVGLAMPPTVLLIYGHPKGGTPIMIAAPRAALELPLQVLVREDADGRARISFHPIAPLLRNAGAPEEMARRLEPAQHVLLKALEP
jgi:uncharacterized protein (DUF302 family)